MQEVSVVYAMMAGYHKHGGAGLRSEQANTSFCCKGASPLFTAAVASDKIWCRSKIGRQQTFINKQTGALRSLLRGRLCSRCYLQDGVDLAL